MLEMVLACVAWRRGWKALGLIPVGLALAFGFILGAAHPIQKPSFALLMADLIASVVLGVMCLVPPSPRSRW